MNDELERTWKETVLAYFKVLSGGETEENHTILATMVGLRPRYELDIFFEQTTEQRRSVMSRRTFGRVER